LKRRRCSSGLARFRLFPLRSAGQAARSKIRCTCTADHFPPRGVRIPRLLRPAAIWRSDVAPAACRSARTGARSAMRPRAIVVRTAPVHPTGVRVIEVLRIAEFCVGQTIAHESDLCLYQFSREFINQARVALRTDP